MKYPFDKMTQRRGSHCVKWDEYEADDLIPLWVADMDFEVAPAITEALRRRVEHGIFGYAVVQPTYYDAVINWYRRRHQWNIEKDWMLYTTGVVPAVSAVIKALTMPGEQVLVLSPVYNCFYTCISNNGCVALESPMKVVEGEEGHPIYAVDWQDFEKKCSEVKTTVFLLCNPHNPSGRVWTKEELAHMNEICMRHQVKVISDEIHGEMVMPGYQYTPFAAVNEGNLKNSVTCCSPSKSFNTAGLQMANVFCENAEWRRRIDRAININETCDVNPFAPLAVEAAYNEGEEWLDELNSYVFANYQALLKLFAAELPTWKVFKMEASYLAWIDISSTGKTADEIAEKLLHDYHVWVCSGSIYGKQTGKNYIRINLACPQARLMEGLQRIVKAMK